MIQHLPVFTLASTSSAATTFTFRASDAGGHLATWCLCTVNDRTGELVVTTDWGTWSYRWNTRSLGAPNLTAFIGDRACVDYLARKLQNEGSTGQRFSPEKTAKELRRLLCEQRLEDGRSQLENRLDPEDFIDGKPLPQLASRYDKHGLPLFSDRCVAAPSYREPGRRERLPYLSRAKARELWDKIGALSDDCGGGDAGATLFFDRIFSIDGFNDYVSDCPHEHWMTEQTQEDRILRESVLPALIAACADRARTQIRARWFTSAPQPPEDEA